MLSLKQLEDVCLAHEPGSGKCRYLRQDDIQYDKYFCLKMKAGDKAKIDTKVAEFLAECRTTGQDPAAAGVPLGDNCSGYPLLKYIEQGYDKDC